MQNVKGFDLLCFAHNSHTHGMISSLVEMKVKWYRVKTSFSSSSPLCTLITVIGSFTRNDISDLKDGIQVSDGPSKYSV